MELGGVDIAILGKRHGLQYQRCGHDEEHRLPELFAASVHRLSISRLRWVRVSLIAGDTGPVITVGAELTIRGDERSSGLMVRADATPGVWGRVQPDGSSSNTPGGGVGNMSFMTPP